MRQRSDPDVLRSEVADNEEIFAGVSSIHENPTTAQQRASASYGRAVLDLTLIEKTAVSVVVDCCSNDRTTIIAVDNYNAVK